jgi:hypothetical protein
MKYIDALKKYNEGKDKWCMPRKGSEDYLKIREMMQKISKISKMSKTKKTDSKDIKKANLAEKNRRIRILQAAIKRKLLKPYRSSRPVGLSSTPSPVSKKLSKLPSYDSGSRVFSNDIYKNQQARKVQQFIKDKVIINKNTLTNRINNYKLLKNKLALLKSDECLEVKTFKGVQGYTIRNIINLEKKIGTKSRFGSIYLTSIPNIIGTYPIAAKIMKNDSDNMTEVKLMTMITNDIILKRLSRHFLMIYGSSVCSKKIAARLKLVSINEFADGDLKMLTNMREVVENRETLFNVLFQTFISIATFHNIVGYIHCDAHYGNFLYQLNNEKGYYHYTFNGTDYYLKACKYNIIIFDYGFSTKIAKHKNMAGALPAQIAARNKLVDRQSRRITYDYQQIIHAFFNKKTGGWCEVPKMPEEPTNSDVIAMSVILQKILLNEVLNNSGGDNYAKRFIGSVIQEVFLKYTPKNMFVTQRPSNVINKTPFIIA